MPFELEVLLCGGGRGGVGEGERWGSFLKCSVGVVKLNVFVGNIQSI